MAINPGLLTHWPWERLGSFKYLLYLPLVANAVRSAMTPEGRSRDNFSLHILVLAALRYIQGQLWITVTSVHDIVKKHQVQTKGMKFDQLDRERDWEDFILLQALMLLAYQFSPLCLPNHAVSDWRGLVITILWHLGPVEFLYYWFHRALHHHSLYRRYHSHHHLSFVTQAVTGNVHPFAEHLSYAVLFGSTLIVNLFLGTASLALIYSYMLWFDFMNYIGHCNWEFMPSWMFQALPLLKYLVYTPSFHSLHHTQVHTNFCLFVPLYDYIYGTVDKTSGQLHLAARQGRTELVDFVFLTHPTDPLSIFHLSFGIPSFAAQPYGRRWYIWLLYPLALPVMLLLWAFGSPFTVEEHTVDKVLAQTWAIPRFSFHFGMTSEIGSLNALIERAILAAQDKGAKFICLGLHNKDEHLNASGALFLKNHPDLSIKVVDGSTLTSAIVLDKLPKDASEVFLVGAEHKVGRAIANYLCRHRATEVTVLAKSSSYAFESLKKSVPQESQHKLVAVESLEHGRHCKAWIVGEPLRAMEQLHAPSGACFYQFTEEAMEETRPDCLYAKLPAMRLPPEYKGIRACEGSMPRGVVQASHAGGILATMENWNHHEVGNTIDVDKIDAVMRAAVNRGFVPYY
ncbi:protein ECERIFERUM 1 [Selaginella moellendorffii]|uniref:protein ECERIFERUM 1 n=1 Tax=Selaginella moellendorffii TaxID=88036 RepID=UPI000D1C226E|nr:protein ECERIFERUM 1 [Selaginella moellendorffii]|eukprot:XP_024524953.1 protein ECERIFERUM 1 [Selaginella moellendorffii]